MILTDMPNKIISACVVINSEESVLRRCLTSLQGVVGEIIVVHDGPPKDNSLKIAEEFGARVFIRPFVGEAEPHRSFSYEQALGEWVLQIDADEFLSEEARSLLPDLVKNQQVDAYSLRWPIFDKGKYLARGHYSKLFKPCLFRKSKLYFLGIVHESPQTYGTAARNICQLNHEPLYDNLSINTFRSKWLKWAKLEAKETLNLDLADTFNIPNPFVSRVYQRRDFMRRYPSLSLGKELVRIVGVNLRDGLLWGGGSTWRLFLAEVAQCLCLHYFLVRLRFLRPVAGKPFRVDSK